MSKAIDQRKNNTGMVKPGELVDMKKSHSLSLNDRRIYNLLIENAWETIGEDKHHLVAISSLRSPGHRGTERVRSAITNLMTSMVEIPIVSEGEPRLFATQLLGDTTTTIDEGSPRAILYYSFPRGLRAIIQDSRYWGRVKLFVMFAFTTKYALTLYEALCLRGNLRRYQQQFSVDAFREMLGVDPDLYQGYPQLKQKVITPAVEQVNRFSEYNVDIDAIRLGGIERGRLVGFRMTWERKPEAEWRTALEDLADNGWGRVISLA